MSVRGRHLQHQEILGGLLRHAGGGLRCLHREHVGDTATQRLRERVKERQERFGRDLQHLSAGGHIDPVFAAALLHLAHDAARESDIAGHDAHLDQRALLAVEVEARILLRGHVHRRGLEALDHGLLRGAAYGARQSNYQY